MNTYPFIFQFIIKCNISIIIINKNSISLI